MNANQTIFLAHDRIADLRRDIDHRAPEHENARRSRGQLRNRLATSFATLGRPFDRSRQAETR